MNASFSDSQTTSQLLARAEAGDTAAFDALMLRHLPRVKRTVRRRLSPRLRPRVDPSDVVQETQHHLHQRLDDYLRRRPMPFRLWVLRTAHERLVDVERHHLGTAKRAVDRELPLPDGSSMQLAAQFVSPGTAPDNAAMRREIAGKVRHSLARLSETDREILMLRCFEGLDNREAATLLELNPETTKKRFTRALLRLQQVLHEQGVTEAGP